ncbi:niemann-Pick type C-related protein 1 [Elasticomyces elasticus]|uniref:Niemann-Pick type C- protein 1 n=1 Tax=Exophiala sideris TaxID=1016849 RepID=A0ABR0JRD1_9EURO|nr:niemann-Pick type C-related protein 1 [Elasticomyces elasticus]KAK5034682.1 niemann-Pick type C-related protein 1 [Exophiala sideris]KAK5039996.1 niemann-Pick type C- protein 1 [Exophiala sideris]KAK5068374.1 niemann-Pick type C- protein 1 [Exophiala sideris]KAK5187676.1 niemann-Pick type C- protein 1 [Eurotiomycetes sp. CCFEE 6388]
MRFPSSAIAALAAVCSIPFTSAVATPLHEAGRCAIRGSCGKQGFFGSDLPCPDNGKASAPSDELRTKLVDLCGPKWQDTDVCCEEGQVDTLKKNLNLAQRIIASCPACKENFFNIFCTFTCSPDQSLFVNVTNTGKATNGHEVVTELDNIWSTEYQSGFYDSCKEVKNGASGGKAMAFIGGGAENYTEFTKFLGDKKLLGSPFQINFLEEPRYEDAQGMKPEDPRVYACNDTDSNYRCSCVDCPAVCPTLEPVSSAEYCHVGKLPCLSFAVIIVYSIALLLLITAISGHVAYRKHRQWKSERLQLLQDAAPSDDEDEGDLVHNPGLLERPQRNYYLNQVFDRAFNRLGGFCARYPALTIGTNIVIVGLLSLGWLRFEIERDPVRLWVSPSSEAAQEKAFFDENFGPFYRTEQVFLVNDSAAPNSSVLQYDNLDWWFDVEERISRMMTPENGITLKDVCFKPTGSACVVQSVSGWFGAGLNSDWKDQIELCAAHPGDQRCLPEFMDPMQPGRVLGGYESIDNILNSTALVTTWVVNNHQPGTEDEARASEWERALKHDLLIYQESARARGLRMSFNTEISLEEELNKSTNTDAKIVAISYVVMFIYASLALGSASLSMKSLLNHPSNAFVQSKFTLGVVGIVIVLMSVSGSVGLFSAAGVKVTLIIAEVIPFLVLAVGVDNIFLIVHEFERVNVSHPDEEIDVRVAKALGRMGPSILLSASTETIAFAMGAFVGMPAVKNFAAYAAGAVFINAVLQVTMFVSVLALNQRRVESLRADCFPCVTVRGANSVSMPGGHFFGSDEEGWLQRFIRKVYAPRLLDKKVKTFVVAFFVTLFAAGIALIPRVDLGLDQRIALPSDSYMIQYFDDLYDYFGSGPPVYFVTRDVNVTERQHQQQLCGGFTTCDEYSLAYVLEQESKRPEVSYINSATANWLDDFFYWLNPISDCCKEDNGDTCFQEGEWNITLGGMPEDGEFIRYIQKWIHAPTDEECPNGGQAAYSNAVVIDKNHTDIPASHFRTFHTPLQGQDDFINSYAAARRISDDISSRHGISVFPYSKHYIFFDQYSSIVRLTATLLCVAVAIIFVLTSSLLGSLQTGAVVAVTAIMIVVDIIGVMALAGVSLNAVSLVNLVICVGISVEFCAHIARAFMFPSKSVMERARHKFRGKDVRAWTALVNVGGSVFSGITITKFLGVAVLAFTRSKIFEVYYFRVWLALVVFASSHALVWLPVALSFFGGEGYIDPESEGGLEEDLASRRYRSLLPDDDYDSDDE